MARDNEVTQRQGEGQQGGQAAGRPSGDVQQAGRQEVRSPGQQGGAAQGGAAQGGASGREDTRALLPRCDVLEDDQGITVLADLPGVSKDTLELRVDGDTLTIEGTVSAAMPQQMEAVYVEVRVPRYRRAFTLSRELDNEKIEASLANGVLQLRIPKKSHAQPKKIAVQVR